MTAPARPHVVVVGDVGIDVLTRLDGVIVPGHDTRARIRTVSGGAGGNTAAWLRRFDLQVSLLARVGDDQGGLLARTELTAAGIDCRFAIDPERPTCTVVVLVEAEGERTMLADRGANRGFGPADVDLPAGAERAHLHLSGYVLLDAESRAGGLAALAAARAAGWTTSVDPQAAVHVAATGADTFLGWIDGIDLLLPNDAELAALGGIDHVLRRVGAVAVTHGRTGASWYGPHGHVETVPVTEISEVDSTGAGDAFNSGLLAAWLRGAPPAQALAAGVAAGSRAAAQVGAQPPAVAGAGVRA